MPREHTPGGRPIRVSILIVHYRTYGELATCLDSLGSFVADDIEVIVVDHASDPAAAARLLQRYPWIRLIPVDANPGFAAGVNVAARAATGRFLLLLNPDSIVDGDVAQVLAAWLEEHPDVAVAGGLVREHDGSVQASARRFPNVTTGFAGRTSWLSRVWPSNVWTRRNLVGRADRPEPMEVDWVSGACMMVRRAAFDEIGGMDERFFLYWEDADLCFRLKRAGWRTIYQPAVGITHLTGRSSAHAKRPSLIAFHRSAFRYFLKHGSGVSRAFSPLVFVALYARLGVKLAALQLARISALVLFLLFGVATWGVYFYAPQPFNANSGDNIWYLPSAMSLAHRGSLDLSPFRADLSRQRPVDVWITALDADPRITPVGDARLNRFPIGPSLLALPLVPLLEPLLADGQSPLQRAEHLAAIAAASTAVVSVLMLMVLVRMLTKSWPLTWSLGLFHAFASPHFSTHHSAFWSHNAVQPMILLALILLVAHEGRYVWLAALPLVLAYATRPDSAILTAAFSVCVLLRFRAASVRYFVLLGAGLGAFFYWSYDVYGTWRPPYYGLLPGAPIFSLAALIGPLFSPNRGLFVFTPVYLLSVAGALLAWFDRRRYPVIYPLAAVAVAGQWLVIAILNPLWWGGFSYGPRMFCPVLPLLTLLVIPALDAIRARSGAAGRGLRLLVAGAVVWSLFVQTRGSFAKGPHEWNYNPNVDLHHEQLWNWSDMQIFR